MECYTNVDAKRRKKEFWDIMTPEERKACEEAERKAGY